MAQGLRLLEPRREVSAVASLAGIEGGEALAEHVQPVMRRTEFGARGGHEGLQLLNAGSLGIVEAPLHEPFGIRHIRRQ